MRTQLLTSLLLLSGGAFAQEAWMPYDPGAVRVATSTNAYKLSNKALSIDYGPKGISIGSWGRHTQKVGSDLFQIVMRDGRVFSSKILNGSDLRVFELVHGAEPNGKMVSTSYAIKKSGLREPYELVVRLDVSMRDHSHYAEVSLRLLGPTKDIDVAEVRFFSWKVQGAYVAGTVPGSPISSDQLFFAIAHPMSASEVKNEVATSSIERKLPVRGDQSVTYSATIGAIAPGQERRSFASFIESTRPRPYDPFLHYNSWYDLGYFNKYNETECLERINTFGNELGTKRAIKISSFLFDDGWDDTSTTWQFHSGFPDGFKPLKDAAAKFGAAPGAWLSPWGGYGKPREERLATAKKNGFETDAQGLALSGPKYYDLFSHTCRKLVSEHGVNHFKFDGTGSPDKKYPGSHFDSDFDAAIHLIEDLRKVNPDLFINLTTGTWPSPFWTRYADSIWRGGSDHGFAGVGPDREKWITYRDSVTYHQVVKRGPLYPLNSLMVHGLIYAQHADKLSTDPGNAFRHEVLSYFGSGTQLQEMYITPSLLTEENWDDLMHALRWSERNKYALIDTHWIGGDPEKLDVYGWASWTPHKSTIILRNPSDEAQAFAIQPKEVLEYPPHYNSSLTFKPVFADQSVDPFTLNPSQSKVLTLAPFEVVVLEGARSEW